MKTLENHAKTKDKKRLENLVSPKTSQLQKTEDDENPGEEEIEKPDSIKNLPEEEQQRAILMLSFKTMMTGLVLVILFSDPMVGVLSAFGKLVGIKPFYVSFVLAPFASNASELLAA